MGGSSADIEALLIDVTDPDNPTPGMLPAIFRDIVSWLDAAGLATRPGPSPIFRGSRPRQVFETWQFATARFCRHAASTAASDL